MDLLDRMVRAVERVRHRLQRATTALEEASIPYAVVGEQAVSAWVSRVDEAAVRNSPAVDILLNRSDLEVAKQELAKAGFVHQHVEGLDLFLDGPEAKPRDAVHVVFAGEKVRADHQFVAPEIHESVRINALQVIAIEPLVMMTLTFFRRRVERVIIRDMIDVGLVDETWLARLPAPLSTG